ncbi:MAG: PHP domain-containing protein, partial [Steroidobacteraceae bacterium]
MYAELHAVSNFSFLKGASQPAEMVARAIELGYTALAMTDECSVAGVVRGHEEAKKHGFHLIVGSEMRTEDGLNVIVLAETRRGYGHLCRLITSARRAAPKGRYRLSRAQLEGALDECSIVWLPHPHLVDEQGTWLRDRFENLWMGAELHRGGNDAARLLELLAWSRRLGIPITACGGALMH